MGREERAKAKAKPRLLAWDESADDRKAFEFVYEVLATRRHDNDADEERAATLLDAFAEISEPKPREPGQNQDLNLNTIAGAARIEVSEGDRDLLLKIARGTRPPTFAVRRKQRAIEILEEAATVERQAVPVAVPGPPVAVFESMEGTD